MDVIYMDHNLTELGVLKNFSLDHEDNVENGKNTFEISCSLDDSVLQNGYYIYIDGSNIGGRIDSTVVSTASQSAKFKGMTYRGLLENKIISPDSGADYFTASGDLNKIVDTVIKRVGLDGLFKADANCGVSMTYQFDRYTDVHKAFLKIGNRKNMKLSLKWSMREKKIIIGFVPVVNLSNESEIGSDRYDFQIEKNSGAVNHIIGLGRGELKDRTVIHRYIDLNGEISTSQHYFGADEITAIYDNSDAESIEDLIEGAEDALIEYAVTDSLSVISNGDIEADLCDSFTAYDFTTNIKITEFVKRKITKITDDSVDYDYEVGGSIL